MAGGIFVIIFNLIRPILVSSQKFRLLACLEPPSKFSVGGWVGGGGSKVPLVFCFGPKPKFCPFDLDQAEQI